TAPRDGADGRGVTGVEGTRSRKAEAGVERWDGAQTSGSAHRAAWSSRRLRHPGRPLRRQEKREKVDCPPSRAVRCDRAEEGRGAGMSKTTQEWAEEIGRRLD